LIHLSEKRTAKVGHTMNIVIKAKSSGENPYDVTFAVNKDVLTVDCSCKAGIFGTLCKHKTELMSGDAGRLYDPNDMDKLKAVSALLSRAREIPVVAAEIAETEKLIKEAQANNKKIKKKFELMLKAGLMLDHEAKPE